MEEMLLVIQTHLRKNKKVKLSDVISTFIDIFFIVLTMLVVFFTPDNIESLPLIGYFIIGLSIYLCYKVRKKEKLLFLFAIVGFINISIGVTDCINKGLYVASWQMPLRESEYNAFTAKSILLFLSVLNLFLSNSWIKKVIEIKDKSNSRMNNVLIGYLGAAAMYIILLMGYSGDVTSTSTYVSNSNPLIEYAVIIYAVVWLFAGKSKPLNFLLKMYTILYIFYSFYYGDRSAAFLMILLYYLLYIGSKVRLSSTKIIILAVFAITLSNFIAGYRSGMSLDLASIIENSTQRGVYSDTVSYSYYASITISAVHHIDNTFIYFLEYLKTIILGGSSSEFGNIANYVKENYLYNVGGGLYTSYFYFGFGFFGVIFGAAVLGITIRLVYSRMGSFAVIYQILIPVLSIRWYLYGPTTLYRSVFVISTVLLFVCIIFDKLVRKQNCLKNR